MSHDIRIERRPNGYETLYLNGKDIAGMPQGIDAMTVLHYLRWWCGLDIDVRKDYLDEEGNVFASLDDGGKKGVGGALVESSRRAGGLVPEGEGG